MNVGEQHLWRSSAKPDQSGSDRLLSRRASWNGVAVRDLSGKGVNPNYGNYYRVTRSGRDAATGAWGIYWRLVEDRIERPEGEPIYLFDGTTWDLPAEAKTVFPKTWAIVVGIPAVLLIALAPVFWSNPVDQTGVQVFAVVAFVALVGWHWFYQTEPVRGTKIGAVMVALSTAHKVAKRREHERLMAEFNANSEVLKHIARMDPDEARRQGFTQ